MSDKYSVFKPLQNKAASLLSGFHPNVLSLTGLLLSLPGCYFYAQGNPLLGSLFILGSALDALDGTVARLRGETSLFGGILDATLDRIQEGVVLLSLAAGGLISWPLSFAAFIAAFSVSYVKAKTETARKSASLGRNEMSVGFLERTERILLVFFASLAQAVIRATWILEFAGYVMLFAATITVVQRLLFAYNIPEIRRAKK